MKKHLIGLLIIAVLAVVIVVTQQDKIRFIQNLKQGGQTSVAAETPKAAKSVSAVDLASAQNASRQDVDRLASEVGVKCLWLSVDECRGFIARIKGNAHLANALQYAKSKNVFVYAENKFSVKDGWVDIDISAKDEDIIKFLVGENAPKK